ncbi:c-type cytochrome [bacterium]|nr:c-type cytochrome [bacterium]
MKIFLKILVGIVGLVVLLIIGGLIYINTRLPNAGPVEDITIESTPERVERGKYLAYHVALCMDCHSHRNWEYYAGPLIPGTDGIGGELFSDDMGFPGNIYSKNITAASSGIKDWTDADIFHAITTGVTKSGEPLFPLMPYHNYRQADKEDIYAIIAYIKTLKPVENQVKQRSLNFPLNLIVRTIPKPADFKKRPETTDTIAYGRYMTTLASCGDCHTPQEKGEPIQGMDFAGGLKFIMPWGTIRTANITPDIETGIGSWTKEQFIKRFKTFDNDAATQIVLKPPFDEGHFNTLMPWTQYAGMTEEDLGAIYTFLRTVKPVKNKVQKYSAEGATYLK